MRLNCFAKSSANITMQARIHGQSGVKRTTYALHNLTRNSQKKSAKLPVNVAWKRKRKGRSMHEKERCLRETRSHLRESHVYGDWASSFNSTSCGSSSPRYGRTIRENITRSSRFGRW